MISLSMNRVTGLMGLLPLLQLFWLGAICNAFVISDDLQLQTDIIYKVRQNGDRFTRCPTNVSASQGFQLEYIVGQFYEIVRTEYEPTACNSINIYQTGNRTLTGLSVSYNARSKMTESYKFQVISKPSDGEEKLFIRSRGELHETLVLDYKPNEYAVFYSCSEGQNRPNMRLHLIASDKNIGYADVQQIIFKMFETLQVTHFAPVIHVDCSDRIILPDSL